MRILDVVPIVLALLAPLTRRVRALERSSGDDWSIENGTLVKAGADNGKENA